MKSFRQFFKEAMEDGNKLPANVVNSINKDLFKLTQVDDKSADINEMFSDINDVVNRYKVKLVSDNYTEFKPSVIINKQQTFVLLAPIDSVDENGKYNVYDNIALNVKWNILDGEYALKEASIKEKK